MTCFTPIRTMLGVFMIGALLFSSVTWAQPGNDDPGQPPFMGKHGERGDDGPDRKFGNDFGIRFNLAALNLSEEQMTQLHEQRREFEISTAELRQKMRFAQQDLRMEMRNEPADQAKIDRLWSEISTLQQQLGDAETEHLLALRNILTPEQLAALQQKQDTAQELRELKEAYRELLLSPDTPDAEKLKQLQTQITEKEIALQKERIEKRTERFQSLSPEQREQFQVFPRRKRRG